MSGENAAWVLRKGDVILYEGEPWYVTSVDLLDDGPRWGEVKIHLMDMQMGVRFKLYAFEDDRFPMVRLRGAKYTAEEWMFLIHGEYEGRPY